MTRTAKAVNVDEIREAARRCLPSFLFDFIDGGVDAETGLSRNRAGFEEYELVPRYLVDVSKRDPKATLFGRTYSMPFGIAPTGPAPLFRPKADEILAAVAKDLNLPFVLSGASGASLEDIARIAPDNSWFQLYPARNRSITEDQIRRAADAGIEALVVTIDTPVTPNRERHRRNSISIPFAPKPATLGRIVSEVLRHPEWFIRYFANGGMPMMGNWQRYASPNATASNVAAFFFDQAFVPGEAGTLSWRDLERYRKAWTGKFIVKGVMHPEDARRAVELGTDGLYISNHGGKSLDRAPATIRALPSIRRAVGANVPIMIDSGIRRGSDIVIALCLGANFVFAGRPTLFGVAADGEAGVRKTIDLLRSELDLVLAGIGACGVGELDRRFLAKEAFDEA